MRPVKEKERTQPVSIPTLADEIDRLLGEAKSLIQQADMHDRYHRKSAYAAGEKLTQAKEKTPHGQWLPALERHGIPERTARYHMSYFKAAKTANFADLPPVKETAEKQAAEDFHEKVKERVKRERPEAPPEEVETEATKRQQEAEAQRKAELAKEQELALEILNIGFKTLAKRLHPDAGGTDDDMSRLNRVMTVLTKFTRGIYEIDKQ